MHVPWGHMTNLKDRHGPGKTGSSLPRKDAVIPFLLRRPGAPPAVCPEFMGRFSSQPHQEPAAAEHRSGLGEENDFHQQHPEEWVSHQPHGAHFQTSPSGESVWGLPGGARSPVEGLGEGASLQQSPPSPSRGPHAQLGTWPSPVSGGPALLCHECSCAPGDKAWASLGQTGPHPSETRPLQGGEGQG